MSDPAYRKCGCVHCGNHIEFPETGAGRLINCPHCGQATRLDPAVQAEPDLAPTLEKPLRTGRGRLVLVALPLVAATALALVYYERRGSSAASPVAPNPDGKPGVSHRQPAADRPPAESRPAAAIAEPPAEPPAVGKEKSLEDLKPGAITFEKSGGGSLVYAVGTLKNDSAFQRFGVTVELDVFDRAGGKLGAARDYKDILEPGQSWRFRALITDTKAAVAKIASIKEQK